jgi:hypothetical protein
VSLSYYDSTGAGPFTVVTSLMGRFPSPISLADHSVDVAIVTDLHVVATGGFGNSIGQITLCELSSVPPPIPTEQDPSAGLQPFFASQDAAQLLIRRALVYLPPSYFALAEQGAATAPAAPPSTDALAIPVGQVVGTSGTAIPPPPPPNPAVLSGTFAQTLSLALAAPVTSAPITFL